MTVDAKRIEELVESGVIPESAVRAFIDEWNPIIHVNRSIRPEYPDFVKEVKYPELELTGPADFDVTKLERYLHPKQVNGYAVGNEIHEELIVKKMLEGCLGLTDLKAIQARGIGFFRKHFAGKAVFGWKSVVLYSNGNLYVPYLCENDDSVELHWDWLDNNFYSYCPALRHAS